MSTDLLPTPAELHELFSYDPATGKLYWKVSRGKAAAGAEVGTRMPVGYIYVGINKRHYYAHRIIWAMQTGAWPGKGEQIDHINRAKDENQWDNLRLVSNSENAQNVSPRKRNASGYLGVYWSTSKKKWAASIKVNYKIHHLGRYNTAEEASAAYLEAKARLHPTSPKP